ncbi:MAG: hypothetical protein G3M70_07295 [Candidatus Nitronauta litoralis]|uniref:Uncharacterized protein n=1 Tax=Candidatus Nitronauta litoralis TaxID=2705533 RepID=A0A7T0FZL4_9BACT|nr:MAG: hypothetical protein G3M70_07295 [Candidatus Nitronauta litoralis]
MALKKVSLVLAKQEVTYGTDPVPVPGANAILVSSPEVKVDGERLVREFDSATLGALGHVIGIKSATVTFSTELKGSGTANAGGAGDVPEIDPLLQACGFALTATAESGGGVGDGDLTYDPVSTNRKSVTLYIYLGDVLHKITGAYGNFSLDLNAGKHGVINWEFQGLYIKPTDAAIPGGAAYNAQAPWPYLSANLTLGAYSPIFEGLSIDIGNSLSVRKDANSGSGVVGVSITERDVSGSLNPESVPEATHPFWTDWENANSKALSTLIGGIDGNKITITAPKVLLNEINWGDRDETRIYETPITLARNSGDDEIKIKFH